MEKVLSAEECFEQVSILVEGIRGICYGASVTATLTGSNEASAICDFSGGVQIVCEALQERLERLWTAMKTEKADRKNSLESEIIHAKGSDVPRDMLAAA